MDNFLIKKLYFLIILLLCAGSSHAKTDQGKPAPIAVYLTWQRSPESTMTINWLTDLDHKDDLIEYQKEGDIEWKSKHGTHMHMPAKTSFLIHVVELTNLQPETTYLFRTNQEEPVYKFQTMPAILQGPLSFIVGGDMYHDGEEILHETNRQAAKTSPLFALVGGDIAYAADAKVGFLPRWTQPWIDILVGQNAERWLTWMIAWTNDMVTPDGRLVPFLPVLGNHDTSGRFDQTPDKAPFFYALFPMPGKQGYNVLDFGNYMSIVLLDSGHTHPIGGKQVKWLRSAMETRQHVPHKFALYHVPAYPSVRKINDEMCGQVRKYWTPIFEEFQLTAAFEHHDHAYKRTHPIKNNQIASDGVVYLGDGAWGVENPRKARRLAQKWYLAHFASRRHFLHVTLDGEKRTASAISPQGEVIDRFTW